MTTLLIQAAGAGIGFAVGGPTGAQYGWVIGGVAAQLFAPPTEVPPSFGPRLGDLKVQAATYGVSVPRVYGCARIAGNVIWTTDIIETATETVVESGGKGGGGSEQTQTTYSYSQSFAVGLCEGPIVGIRKIWANGKLIYSLAEDATADTVNAAVDFTIYTGSETQTASALQESYLGVGNVPAYRGLAYVEFEDLQLGPFGNRTPNLEFEVVTVGTITVGDAETDFQLVASAVATDVNTITLDTTGADTIFVCTWGATVPGTTDTSDSYGNHWERLAVQDSSAATAIVWAEHATVGPSHQIDCAYGANGSFCVLAFSGNPTSSPQMDASNGFFTNSLVSSIQPGSVTPNGQHILAITSVGLDGDNPSIGFGVTAGYTIGEFSEGIPGSARGGAAAYQTNPTDAAALNPTWSWSGSFAAAAVSILMGARASSRLYVGTIYLSEIVSSECLLSGLSASDIDVTALAAIPVDGYVVANVGPARGTIEPLMEAFFVDAVESDNVIKFVVRGGAAAGSIAQTELAAHDSGEPPSPLEVTRREETELPVELVVTYMARDNNYQPGTQRERRQTTRSDNKEQRTYSIVFTDDYAQQLADALMYSRWQERDTVEFQTSRAQAIYEPADVLTVTSGETAYRVRVQRKDVGTNGVLRWSGVIEDASVYTQTSVGATMITPTNSIPLPPEGVVALMDIPLLREVDDAPGFYGAVCGEVYDTWRGQQLYRSTDGGTNYAALSNGRTIAPAVIGEATTVLGTVTRTEQFDEGNSVTVLLNDGLTLSSVTSAQVSAGTNWFAIGDNTTGWEIIGARTATLVDTDTYTLTGLLRGRLGTESLVGTHAVGDSVILLDEGTIRTLTQSWSEVDVELIYKSVTFGRTLAQSTEVTFTNTARRKKPLAPVQLKAGRDGSGDWQIAWVRRTRFPAEWRDGVDAPLGETTEAYEIDIMDGSTVVRTITATTDSANYTAAQWASDFTGSPTPTTITINVYQMSSDYGRGYAATGTFS